MAKQYVNLVIDIPKNEESDVSATLRIQTDAEQETVSISKHNWDGPQEIIRFPRQFIGDVAGALNSIQKFIEVKKDEY